MIIIFSMDKTEFFAVLIVLVLVFSGAFGILVFRATNEAAAFNRFTTGQKATVWDALFVELRVEAQCNQQKAF